MIALPSIQGFRVRGPRVAIPSPSITEAIELFITKKFELV